LYLITIHGMVTLNGKPLASGQAIFIPDNPSRGASGAAIKDGIFTIKVYKGSNRVEINGQETEQRPVAPGAPPEAGVVSKSIIPSRYNEKSTLTCDVKSEKDRPAFELTNEK